MSRRQSFPLIVAPKAMVAAGRDAKTILDQSLTLDAMNQERLRAYVWNSEETAYRNGRVSAQQRFEINLVSGAMYWRKLESNGKPLTGIELEAERQRLAAHLGKPGPGYNWRAEREYLDLLPQTHQVRYVGETVVRGRTNHILQTEPRRGTEHPMLSSFAYKLWIDQAELHWTRAEVKVLRKVTWLLHQLPIGRLTYPYSHNIVNNGTLSAGATTTIELQRLPDGVWTLDTYETQAGKDFRNVLRYYNYRKFSSESQLLAEP